MTRRRGLPSVELLAVNEKYRWWRMDDATDSATAARNDAGGTAAVWTGGHTRSNGLWGFDDIPVGHGTDDDVWSQYVTGASYVTVDPATDAAGEYLSANPWFWCFVQPDADVGNALVARRVGVWEIAFNGTDITATATLTDASTLSVSAPYGAITDAHLVLLSFTDSDKKLRLYLDGDLVATSAAGSAGIVSSSTALLYYGGAPGATNFRGYLDDFAIHKSVGATLNNIATDTLVRRLWLQMKGVQFPYFETFGIYPDGGVAADFITPSGGTWDVSDGRVEGPLAPSATVQATFHYPFHSQQVYYETALWFPVWGPSATRECWAGISFQANDGDAPYELNIANGGQVISGEPVAQFLTDSGAWQEVTLAALGIDIPDSRSKAIRLGLVVTHSHGAAEGRPTLEPFVNGVALQPADIGLGTWYYRGGLHNRGQFAGIALAPRFEYFYIDTTLATPPPDYHEPVVGSVGSRPAYR